MHTFRDRLAGRSRRRAAWLALAAGAALVPSTALGASTTVTGTITGGSLALTTTATPSFGVTLNGTDQTPAYSAALNASDTTGTGSGWNLTVTSTQFTTGGATPSTLATGASSITGVTSLCASGTCTSPTNAIAYPVGVPAGATAPTPVKFFNAAAATGLGRFTVTPTVQVSVPANALAGTYTSTVTLAIVSGP